MAENRMIVENNEPIRMRTGEIIRAVSPTVDLEREENGLRVTVHDIRGEQTETVHDGDPGDPGFSPIVAVEETENGHRVIITDAGGIHEFDVPDGEQGDPGDPGDDGVSPTATVTKAGKVATITITDKTGTTTATVSDGQDGDPGSPGADGTTYTPSVSADGDLSWTNDGGKPNPQTVNIKGPKGDDYVLTAQDKADIAAEVEVPVQDVQVNGTSILSNGVANVPIAGADVTGVVKTGDSMQVSASGFLNFKAVGASEVKAGTSYMRALTPERQHASAFYGLAKAAGDSTQSASSNAVGTYTESAKSAISQMLNGPISVPASVNPLVALPGVQYICGERATLDITLPASGCIDVVFESGSTPTVLTITPPTGVTVQWANGFDPTVLAANTTYEINILNGLGVACKWM